MVQKNELRKWFLTALVLIIGQLSDFIVIPNNPGWYLYLWGAFIDSAVLLIIFRIGLSTTVMSVWRYDIPCWMVLSVLQISAVSCHLGGVVTELLYNMLRYEQLAVLNDQYIPWLIFILVLKVLALLVGANEIRRRYANTIRADNCCNYNNGFIVIRDTIRNKIPKE